MVQNCNGCQRSRLNNGYCLGKRVDPVTCGAFESIKKTGVKRMKQDLYIYSKDMVMSAISESYGEPGGLSVDQVEARKAANSFFWALSHRWEPLYDGKNGPELSGGLLAAVFGYYEGFYHARTGKRLTDVVLKPDPRDVLAYAPG